MKYGTCLANSLQGSDFAYVAYNGRRRGGGGEEEEGESFIVLFIRRCFDLSLP